MVQITLEPQCLGCSDLKVLDATIPISNYGGLIEFHTGEITCEHINTCKFMGDMPNVSKIIDKFIERQGGE